MAGKLRASLIVSVAGAIACVAYACNNTQSTLLLDNEATSSFTEVNLAAVDAPTWGPNLVGDVPLAPGEQLQITQIDCDVYDLRIVASGQECVLPKIDICSQNSEITVTDADLADCSGGKNPPDGGAGADGGAGRDGGTGLDGGTPGGAR